MLTIGFSPFKKCPFVRNRNNQNNCAYTKHIHYFGALNHSAASQIYSCIWGACSCFVHYHVHSSCIIFRPLKCVNNNLVPILNDYTLLAHFFFAHVFALELDSFNCMYVCIGVFFNLILLNLHLLQAIENNQNDDGYFPDSIRISINFRFKLLFSLFP